MTMSSSPDFEVRATGLWFPEGPIALRDGSVLLVEIGAGCLTRIAPDGRAERIAETGGGPNGAALGPDGACYVCNNGGFRWGGDAQNGRFPAGRAADYAGGRIERIELASGQVQRLHERTPRGPLSGPNDIVFDKGGGCWFTDLGHMGETAIERGSICYAPADGGALRLAVQPMLTPNGIGLSPDEKTLYVAETVTARLWAFDIVAPGELALQPMPPALSPGRLLYAAAHYCMFDSLAVEAGGNICVATIGVGGQASPGGAGITVVAPDGRLVEQVYLPDRATTNICFGGPDLRTAFVTQSRSGRLLAMPWPRPGLALNFGA
jgi:gluconolactonase